MLSIIIPAWNEAANLFHLLPLVHQEACRLGDEYEILVVDKESWDGTKEICSELGARCLTVREKGYGHALRTGFSKARGDFLLTMDADLSHPSDFIRNLWQNRNRADVIVASRYVNGGRAEMPLPRLFLSRLLNFTFSRLLDINTLDLSSGFRLYRKAVLEDLAPSASDFNILQEILLKVYSKGYRILEVPFTYHRREHGSSHARLAVFAFQYLKTLGQMWKLRNSIESGDYDSRAYNSRIPLQRWWQRKRYDIIVNWASSEGPALDIGCGSSRILKGLPEGSTGLDPSLDNLRHARHYGQRIVAGKLPDLPFPNESFQSLVCSQVIEHLAPDDNIFKEFYRLLIPGGQLILGTPDYGRLRWKLTELLYSNLIPGGYADKHITRYTRQSLKEKLDEKSFRILEESYIGGGELILRCRKEHQESRDRSRKGSSCNSAISDER